MRVPFLCEPAFGYFLLGLLALTSALASLFLPWYYVSSERSATGFISTTFFDVEGLSTTLTVSASSRSTSVGFDASAHEVAQTFKIAFFLQIGALCGLACALIIAFGALIAKRKLKHTAPLTPFDVLRYLIIALHLLAFLASAAAFAQFFRISSSFNHDSNSPLLSVLNCNATLSPCSEFYGDVDARQDEYGVARMWGPALGWLFGVACTCFSFVTLISAASLGTWLRYSYSENLLGYNPILGIESDPLFDQ